MRGRVTTRIRERPWQTFAKVHAWARTLEPEWRTTVITFQRKPELVVMGGIRWRLQMSMSGWTKSRQDRHVGYTLQIIMSSYEREGTQGLPRKLRAAYSRVAKRLGELGYSATWYGHFGVFQRVLRRHGTLRREVERLQTSPFKNMLSD